MYQTLLKWLDKFDSRVFNNLNGRRDNKIYILVMIDNNIIITNVCWAACNVIQTTNTSWKFHICIWFSFVLEFEDRASCREVRWRVKIHFSLLLSTNYWGHDIFCLRLLTQRSLLVSRYAMASTSIEAAQSSLWFLFLF